MKQGIHPDYKQTTIKCACGEIIETGSTKETSQSKFVQNVILSSQVSRSSLIQAAVLKNSERNLVLKTSNFVSKLVWRCSRLCGLQ